MDQKHIENTKRVAKNTVFLYGRMMFGMFVSLYTSRLILSTLGVDDYGILNVVGGFVMMFSLISGALTSSISRFLTFELGANNQERLKQTFATALTIQIVISILIIIIAETIGIWFVNCRLVIPSDRLDAANWVFQSSVFSFILGLLSSPYNASIISHERMNIFAYFGILQIMLNLANVLFISFSGIPMDKMIVYSLFMAAIGLIMQIIYTSYCFIKFPECRVFPQFIKERWKQMSGFAIWNAIGNIAGILKDQGVNLLLNLFFGPVVNAARGLANSVSGAVGGFTGNFLTAINPQITKTYASQDRDYCFSLVRRGSRFGYYITMIIAIPFFFETPFILDLWLGHYPEYTVMFVRLTLFCALIDTISSTLINLQGATGKIRNYHLAVGTLLLMNFPISYLFLKLGASPYSVYFVAIAISIGCLFLRLVFVQHTTGMSMSGFIRNVIINVIITNFCALILPFIIYFVLPQGFLRLFVLGFVCLISSLMCVLFIGCSQPERNFIVSKIPICNKNYKRQLVS